MSEQVNIFMASFKKEYTRVCSQCDEIFKGTKYAKLCERCKTKNHVGKLKKSLFIKD